MVVDNSREGQIAAIEKTFQRFMKKADRISPARSMTEDEFLASLKHPTKPGVTAVESLPIFPDFNIWGNSYTLVTFDVDPEINNERSVQSQANDQGVRLSSLIYPLGLSLYYLYRSSMVFLFLLHSLLIAFFLISDNVDIKGADGAEVF